MTTLQTADGRLLRAQRPNGSPLTGFFPTQFPPLWSSGETHGDGELRSFEAIYRSQPVLAGAVDKLTRRIATLPLVAYQEQSDGTREATTGDSLDTLIGRPMPRRSTAHLIAHIAQSLLIHGNAVVAKVRSDPDLPPDMLWPLNWAQLSAYGETGGTIEWWSTAQFGAQERFIRAEDTIHFAWTGPDGSEFGVSPLEKLGVTVRLEDAAQRHQTGMFKNGARPSLAVALDLANPKRDQLEYARSRVEAMHRGADNSGRTFFMGSNVKLQPLSLSPVEVELIQQRKLDREEIGMVYDLAGPLMGDLEHGTFSNVAELLRSLYRDIIPPWTELMVQTFQAQLIDQEPAWLDRFVRFDFSDKLKGDPAEQAAVDKSDVEAGIRTRDEARDGRGLGPKGGVADELTANMNNQRPIDEPVPAPVVVPPPPPQGNPAEAGPPTAPPASQA